jgi:hypothetical protein
MEIIMSKINLYIFKHDNNDILITENQARDIIRENTELSDVDIDQAFEIHMEEYHPIYISFGEDLDSKNPHEKDCEISFYENSYLH